MKSINVVLASLVAAVAGATLSPAVQAQSGEQLSSPDYRDAKSLRTREEVRTEAVQATNGAKVWSAETGDSYQGISFVSTKTRDEVAADAREASRDALRDLNGEAGPAVASLFVQPRRATLVSSRSLG
jgi:hypothetical protein